MFSLSNRLTLCKDRAMVVLKVYRKIPMRTFAGKTISRKLQLKIKQTLWNLISSKLIVNLDNLGVSTNGIHILIIKMLPENISS